MGFGTGRLCDDHPPLACGSDRLHSESPPCAGAQGDGPGPAAPHGRHFGVSRAFRRMRPFSPERSHISRMAYLSLLGGFQRCTHLALLHGNSLSLSHKQEVIIKRAGALFLPQWSCVLLSSRSSSPERLRTRTGTTS